MAVDFGCDEGGADDTLLVSCQMAVTEQARRFQRYWKKRLGVLPYFHSKELWNFSYGVFTDAGLDRKERSKLVIDLASLIHRHLTLGLTARISKKLYENVTTQEFRSRWGTAYSFAIHMMLLATHLRFKKADSLDDIHACRVLPTEVNVLIEDGHRHAAQALEMVNSSKQIPIEKRFVTVLTAGLGSKADHPILQAADMLVYSKWQEISNGDHVIHDALHDINGACEIRIIECREELIREVVMGLENWKANRRQWWESKRNKIDDTGV